MNINWQQHMHFGELLLIGRQLAQRGKWMMQARKRGDGTPGDRKQKRAQWRNDHLIWTRKVVTVQVKPAPIGNPHGHEEFCIVAAALAKLAKELE
jgi:hypothetical protein